MITLMREKGFASIILVGIIIVLSVVGIYYLGINKNRSQTKNPEPQKASSPIQSSQQNRSKPEIDSLMTYRVPEGFNKTVVNPEPDSGPYTFQQVILETPGFKGGGAGQKGSPGAVITIWINDNPYTQEEKAKEIDNLLHPSDPQIQRDCQNPTLTKVGASDAVTCEETFEVQGYSAVATIYHNNRRFNISYGYIPLEGKDFAKIISSFLQSIRFKD